MSQGVSRTSGTELTHPSLSRLRQLTLRMQKGPSWSLVLWGLGTGGWVLAGVFLGVLISRPDAPGGGAQAEQGAPARAVVCPPRGDRQGVSEGNARTAQLDEETDLVAGGNTKAAIEPCIVGGEEQSPPGRAARVRAWSAPQPQKAAAAVAEDPFYSQPKSRARSGPADSPGF
jgi:hypothetical protein